MTPNQKKAIQYLNKIKEQWWNTRDGQTNLPEEWYMTILDAIVDYRPIRREDVCIGCHNDDCDNCVYGKVFEKYGM